MFGAKEEKLYEAGLQEERNHKNKKAKSYFLKAAKLGHPGAQWHYGLLCEMERQYKEAIYWYEQAAEQAYIPALGWCVKRYFDKSHPGFDLQRGRYWASRIKEFNLPQEDERVQEILQYGTPEGLYAIACKEKDRKYRVALFEIAAEQGYPRAILRCGEIYRTGSHEDPAKPDPKRAWECFKNLADQNGVARLAAVWMAFYENESLDVDRNKLMSWCEQHAKEDPAVGYFLVIANDDFDAPDKFDDTDRLHACEWAADQGCFPEEMLHCAQMYIAGKGTERNFAKAESWYEKAICEGKVIACIELGDLYRTGGPGLVQDKEKALDLYSQAALRAAKRKNYWDPVDENQEAGAYGLARSAEMYLLGDGVKKDIAMGIERYIHAGFCFADVRRQDVEEAEKQTKLDVAAIYLGRAFFRAGMNREALPLLQLSAENGRYGAMLSLAALHVKGVPGMLDPDEEKAEFCFQCWKQQRYLGRVLFGAYPQQGGDFGYNRNITSVHGLFEPVVWDVLKIEADRVLLLSTYGLEYASLDMDRESWAEYYTDQLFTPAEKELLEGMVFSLSRDEFEEHVKKGECASIRTEAVMYAREQQAYHAGLKVTRTTDGGLKVSQSEDLAYEESRQGGTYRKWMKLLTTRDSSWLLKDGAVVDGEYTDQYTINQMVIRPAVWVRIPKKK